MRRAHPPIITLHRREPLVPMRRVLKNLRCSQSAFPEHRRPNQTATAEASRTRCIGLEVEVTVSDEPYLFVGIDASASGFAAINSFFTRMPPYAGMEHPAPSHPIALTEVLPRAMKLPATEFRGEPNQGDATE